MSEHRWLTLILLATGLLGLIYAVVNPVFEGGDELWHYPMVQHLANGNPLPVQVTDPADAGPWKQQASQPPLYYYAAAALTFWIDTSDMHEVRWQNPHVDNGIITQDGNRNLTIHNPNWSPWQGTLLAVRVVRLFSVLLGVGTVYFTWKFGRLAVPSRPYIALTTAALVGFLPMRLFVSAAVNNDNGIMFLATLSVYLLARHVELADSEDGWHKRVVLIGAMIGLACVTKIVGVGLLPLALGALFLAQWRSLDGDPANTRFTKLPAVALRTVRDLAIVALLTFAIAGWWYIRNVQLYDDWRGWSAFIAVLGERNQPATLAQLWDERVGFMQAFWGLFGGVNVPMHAPIYFIFNGVAVLSVFGFIIYLLVELRRFKRQPDEQPALARALTWVLDLATKHATVVIALVWTAAIVYGLIDWATTTWSSQGRLVFGALQAEMLLVTLGLLGWMGRDFGRILSKLLVSFLFIVALAAPFLYIRPAYMAPAVPERADVVALSLDVSAEFNDSIRLSQVWVSQRQQIIPNTGIDIYTEWEVLQPMERNWSVFVHINDTVLNTPIAQRDMYLGQGALATSFLEPGQRIFNKYRLEIPPTAATPADLELTIGLYDINNNERMQISPWADTLPIQSMRLVGRPGELPNATDINFEDQLALVGYEFNKRRLAASDTLDITLHLSPRVPLDTDYSITTQVVSEELTDTTRWAAADSVLPSSQWQVGEVYDVTVSTTFNPETPADVYRLIMGIYTQTDGTFRNLNLVQDGRITNDNLLTLTKVRIDQP